MIYSPLFGNSFSFHILSLQCMHDTLNAGRGKIPLYMKPISSVSYYTVYGQKKFMISQTVTLLVVVMEKTSSINSIPVSFHDQS